MIASPHTQLDPNHFVYSWQPSSEHQSQFQICFVDVQRQNGGSDCGLFAICFVTALCGGQDPHLQTFEQTKMREHLKQCFVLNRLECYPESRRRRRLGQHRFVAKKQMTTSEGKLSY